MSMGGVVREEWVAALAAHVDQMERTLDPGVALDPGMLATARRLYEVLGDDDEDLSAWRTLAWFYWQRGMARYVRGENLFAGEDVDEVDVLEDAMGRCFIAGLDMPDYMVPTAAIGAGHRAFDMLAAAEQSPDIPTLTTLAQLWSRIIAAVTVDYSLRPDYLRGLSATLADRFLLTNEPADLDAAVAVGRQAVETASNDDQSLPGILQHVAVLLETRFELAGNPVDLDTAIGMFRRSAGLLPDGGPGRAWILALLGTSLGMRFQNSGDRADVDAGIAASRQAVQEAATDDENLPQMLRFMGELLILRAGQHGNTSDLDEAIDALRRALDGWGDDDPGLAICLAGLCNALLVRFVQVGDPSDLDEAVSVGRQAVKQAAEAGPVLLGRCQLNLGAALLTRVDRDGTEADETEGIAVLQRAAAAMPPGNPLRTLCLSNLSATLLSRSQRTRSQTDLDDAVAYARQALAAAPDGGQAQAAARGNLCGALAERYERTLDPEILQEALLIGRSMVAAVPDGHPEQARILSSLGSILASGYENTHNTALLDEAIAVHRRAMAALRDGHPGAVSVCNNLANALDDRFKRDGERRDIDEAIALYRRAALAAAGTVDAGWPLLGLGRALLARMGQAVESDELNRAIETLRKAAELLPGQNRAEGQAALARALRRRFEWSGHGSDLDEATALSRAAVDATPVGHPHLGTYRAILGEVLATRVAEEARAAEEAVTEAVQAASGEQADRAAREELITAVAVHVERIEPPDLTVTLDPAALSDVRRLTALLDGDDTPDLDAWGMVGFFQWVRFRELPAEPEEKSDEALDAAIHAYVPLFVAGREIPWQGFPAVVAEEVADGVGINLFQEVLSSPNLERVDQVIGLWRRILQTMPESDEADKAPYHAVLAAALSLRHGISGQPEDLEEGIILFRRALETASLEDPNWAFWQGSLGEALLRWFHVAGDFACLEEAVAATGGAAAAGIEGEEGTALRIQHAMALLSRSQLTGDNRDLETATALLSQAVHDLPADPVDRATALAYLAETLRMQAERTGDEAVLERSVSAATEAVAALPDGHPNRALAVLNLGVALMMRAMYSGSDADLGQAIGHLNRGVETHAPGHIIYVLSQANLARALLLRFLLDGRRTDLNAAIDVARRVMIGSPTGSLVYPVAVVNLASALLTRFTWDSDEADLDGAIDAARVAFESFPPESPFTVGALSILTMALRRRLDWLEDGETFNRTRTIARQVLDAIPADAPDHQLYRAGISAPLWRVMYQFTEDPAELDQAIGLARQAVELVPEGHALVGECLAELAAGLQLRFELSSSEADFSEAEAVLKRALEVSADSDLGEYRLALADLRVTRLRRRWDKEDHLHAAAYYLVAAQDEAARPWIRIRAARRGAALAAIGSLHERAADMLEIAVLQLPLVVSRQLARSAQQRALSDSAFLASDAAAIRLEAGGEDAPARALGLLELGRAVLQGQALDMRQDLIALHVAHPALAEEFVRVRDLLDAPPDAALGAVLTGAVSVTTVTGPDRHMAADEFGVLLGRIRALDGFGSFLLPPPSAELTAQAASGPIAVFNVSRYRSDALVVTKDAITQVPLPELTYEALTAKVEFFNDALAKAKDPYLSSTERIRAENVLSETLEWLWNVAAKPVLSQLGHVRTHKEGESWPRVWWIPGGLLGALPLHAAGYHRSAVGETVMDRVLSSYVPSVRALAYTRSRRSLLSPRHALIVAMPTTPGQSDLPGAAAEAVKLTGRLPTPTVLIERPGLVDDATPTRDTVMMRLAEAAIVHFACHAASHPTDPSRSLILLHDYREHQFTVASLVSARLHQAQLAYLSACETARNQVIDLADEAIHLTSAFQLAGYPHVIGTLWTISDAIAVDIAESFYSGLQQEEKLDISRSAAALHHAVRSVRDRDGHSAVPSLWAAFTHTGA
jgi:tetratricopeptide (TPR) repeat protein